MSGVIDDKAAMLAAHASQRDWLLKHHGMDQYVSRCATGARRRGRECGVAFAEGFRQHLGHSYPQDDLLGELLGALSPAASASERVERSSLALAAGNAFHHGPAGLSTTQSSPHI